MISKYLHPGCSLEGLMLRLKLQYFGHLMRKVDSLEKTLMLGGIGGRRRRGDRGWDGWMASPTDAHEFEWTLGVGDGQGGLACCDSWGRKESDTTERLNWTELNWTDASFFQEASGVYTARKWGNKPGKRKITYWGSRWFPSRHEMMRTPRMVFGNQS